MSKLRHIAEKLPQKREIGDWSEAKIASFVRFALFFTEPCTNKGKPDHRFVLNAEKWATAKANKDEEFWEEFCLRVDKKDATLHTIKLRLMMAVRSVLGWIKSNPYAVTEELEAIMKDNKRTSWALRGYVAKTTEMGNQIVALDNDDMTDPGRRNAAGSITNVSTPEVQYRQAVLRMTSILNNLTKGIKKSDIDLLSAKEKIQMAVNLSGALTRTFKSNNVNNNFFKTVIVNQASREDLEARVLDYANHQLTDDE